MVKYHGQSTYVRTINLGYEAFYLAKIIQIVRERFMGMNRAHTSNWLIQIFPTMPLAIGTMRLAQPSANVFESFSS